MDRNRSPYPCFSERFLPLIVWPMIADTPQCGLNKQMAVEQLRSELPTT